MEQFWSFRGRKLVSRVTSLPHPVWLGSRNLTADARENRRHTDTAGEQLESHVGWARSDEAAPTLPQPRTSECLRCEADREGWARRASAGSRLRPQTLGSRKLKSLVPAHTRKGQSFANINTLCILSTFLLGPGEAFPSSGPHWYGEGFATPMVQRHWVFDMAVPWSNHTSSLRTSSVLYTFTWDFGVSTFTQVFFGSPYIPSRDPEPSPSFQKPLDLFT